MKVPWHRSIVVASFLGSFIGFSAIATGSARAQTMDRCNDILRQDLFNKTQSQSEKRESAQQAQTAAFFSQEVSAAYSEYSREYDNEKKQGTSAHVDGHYGLAGGAADFAHSYNRKLSEEEFRKEF